MKKLLGSPTFEKVKKPPRLAPTVNSFTTN
jgi:hypothetical protein